MKTETLKTVKLGEIRFVSTMQIRKHRSLDHIHCIARDLKNGANLDGAILVDLKTLFGVGGEHTYCGYKVFFGQGWERQKVKVRTADLPPYDEDPAAWHLAAALDNNHTVLRMNGADRIKVANLLIKDGIDPESPKLKEVLKIPHFTPDSWREHYTTYLEAIKQGYGVDGKLDTTITQDLLPSFFAGRQVKAPVTTLAMCARLQSDVTRRMTIEKPTEREVKALRELVLNINQWIKGK